MVHPQFADGGEGIQILRVAANILNKQSRTAGKGWPSSLGIGQGTNNSPVQKKKCYEMLQRVSLNKQIKKILKIAQVCLIIDNVSQIMYATLISLFYK
jgi:hypothetical protein